MYTYETKKTIGLSQGASYTLRNKALTELIENEILPKMKDGVKFRMWTPNARDPDVELVFETDNDSAVYHWIDGETDSLTSLLHFVYESGLAGFGFVRNLIEACAYAEIQLIDSDGSVQLLKERVNGLEKQLEYAYEYKDSGEYLGTAKACQDLQPCEDKEAPLNEDEPTLRPIKETSGNLKEAILNSCTQLPPELENNFDDQNEYENKNNSMENMELDKEREVDEYLMNSFEWSIANIFNMEKTLLQAGPIFEKNDRLCFKVLGNEFNKLTIETSHTDEWCTIGVYVDRTLEIEVRGNDSVEAIMEFKRMMHEFLKDISVADYDIVRSELMAVLKDQVFLKKFTMDSEGSITAAVSDGYYTVSKMCESIDDLIDFIPKENKKGNEINVRY